MPNSLADTTQRIISHRRRAGHARRRFVSWTGWGIAAALALLLPLTTLGGGLYYVWLSQGLPAIEALPVMVEPPDGLFQQPSRLYDRSGELLLTLKNPAAEGREYLYVDSTGSASLPVFSSTLISATLATLDPDFQERAGASWDELNPTADPTLTQKLAGSLLFDEEPAGLARDLRIRLVSAQVLDRYGKEKILEWYLNTADYGSLAYGADAAARVYFGKSATGLALGESAILAAVSQAPALNPLDAPDAAVERGQQVLERMHTLGWITAAQASALDEPPRFREAVPETENLAPAFTRLALNQLETIISRARLERGGLIIRTSLDLDLQLQLNCALSAQLDRLDQIETTSRCSAADLLPTQPFDAAELPEDVAANVLVYDPQSGEILALATSDSDVLARRPAGTLLSPFVYLTAFTRGMSPATLTWDIPDEKAIASVENFDGSYHGPVRLRTALANDYQVPLVKLLNQIGPGNVWRLAAQLGLDDLDANGSGEDPLEPLSGGKANLIELTRAYGVLAAQGNIAGEVPSEQSEAGELPLQPFLVASVKSINGEELLPARESRTRPLLTEGLAYLVTHVLSDEAARWPSLGHPNSLEIGRPAAAKLGRTSDGRDAWTIGYTPQRVVGVWIGPAQGSETDKGRVPVSAAAGLWHAVIQYASRDLPPSGWTIPQGVTTLTVCDPSGMLPSGDCPNLVNEVFLQSSEPTHSDTLYQRVAVNRLSGQLATLFTPADLVEERVYLIPPVEARDWAQEAGLEIAPESYDLVPDEAGKAEGAQVTTPVMFAYVSGEVEIEGSAAGDDFSFYRVQVGEGLNPRSWIQLGADSSEPVNEGRLATWDTHGLDGLYAIQLLVIDTEHRLQKSTLFVSVDNTAPGVRIRYPHQDQHITPDTRSITLRASAEDDLSLASVEFIVDGDALHLLTQPPFAIQWMSRSGEHTLTVVAEDAAGNTSETTSRFTIE